MKKIFVLLGVALLAFSACSKPEEVGVEEKPVIVATLFPLYDITKNIAGDKFEVINLVPSGASPHTFELTPDDTKNLYEAKTIFAVGHLDEWVSESLTESDQEKVVHVDEGINFLELAYEDDHEEESEEDADHNNDPHYWLSPKNGKIIAQNVANQLIMIDPLNREFYMANLKTYQSELDKTFAQIDGLLKPLKNRDLVLFHESYNYLAKEFDLNVLTVFEPSPGQEPDPEHLKEFYDLIKEKEVRAVFSEVEFSASFINSFVADLNKNLPQDKQVKVYILDPLGGSEYADSYIDMLMYNAKTIYEGLNN